MKDQKEELRKSIYHDARKNKYQGINLPKEAKDLYSENYKTKEIKDDTERYHALRIQESILSK